MKYTLRLALIGLSTVYSASVYASSGAKRPQRTIPGGLIRVVKPRQQSQAPAPAEDAALKPVPVPTVEHIPAIPVEVPAVPAFELAEPIPTPQEVPQVPEFQPAQLLPAPVPNVVIPEQAAPIDLPQAQPASQPVAPAKPQKPAPYQPTLAPIEEKEEVDLYSQLENAILAQDAKAVEDILLMAEKVKLEKAGKKSLLQLAIEQSTPTIVVRILKEKNNLLHKDENGSTVFSTLESVKNSKNYAALEMAIFEYLRNSTDVLNVLKNIIDQKLPLDKNNFIKFLDAEINRQSALLKNGMEDLYREKVTTHIARDVNTRALLLANLPKPRKDITAKELAEHKLKPTRPHKKPASEVSLHDKMLQEIKAKKDLKRVTTKEATLKERMHEDIDESAMAIAQQKALADEKFKAVAQAKEAQHEKERAQEEADWEEASQESFDTGWSEIKNAPKELGLDENLDEKRTRLLLPLTEKEQNAFYLQEDQLLELPTPLTYSELDDFYSIRSARERSSFINKHK